jgi:ribosomal protein S18 acetylase RimI-like enzyme
MNLRKAELKDRESILKIIKLLHLNVHLNNLDFVWEDEVFVEKQIIEGNYFVVEINNEVAGIISFRQRGEKMYIETLSVVEKYRRQGVGTKLIDFAKEYTKEKKLNLLCACSFYEYQAVDFYLKQGFSLMDESGEHKGHKFHRFQKEIL